MVDKPKDPILAKLSEYPGMRAVGIPWYKRETFRAVQAIMIDREKLDDDFARWEKKALAKEQELKGAGHVVVRAHLDAEEFPHWCAANGLRCDTTGRTMFAAWRAKVEGGKDH